MLISFENQCVVVTGASKGIGLACALAFAQAGAKVVGVSRSQANLQMARELAARQGLVLHTLAVDLEDAQAAIQAVGEIEAEHGPIDVLVNSAGAARRYAPEELDISAFHQGMDAKYFTYIHMMQPVLQQMLQRGRGNVVNIVGMGGRVGKPTHIPGGAANAALMLATVGYARAAAAQGVRVNAINPGFTRTTRVEEGLQALARATGRSTVELLEEQVASIPMGRMAEPEEIANMALFLASPHASYVSGAIIPMDGCENSVL